LDGRFTVTAWQEEAIGNDPDKTAKKRNTAHAAE
jgi:hypothetical protein